MIVTVDSLSRYYRGNPTYSRISPLFTFLTSFRAHYGEFCMRSQSNVGAITLVAHLGLHFPILHILGTHLECQYALMTYGILEKSLPIDTHGEMNLAMQENFISKRITKEQKMSLAKELELPSDDIEIPLSRDVVLGRGYPYQVCGHSLLRRNPNVS